MSALVELGKTLLEVASVLKDYFLKKPDAEERKQKEAILTAVSEAFYKTERYYAFRGAGNLQNPERELEIARDWEHAAILIQAVDKNLGERLHFKARSWLESAKGETLSPEHIKEAGIQLRRIRAEGMTLFEKPKPKRR